MKRKIWFSVAALVCLWAGISFFLSGPSPSYWRAQQLREDISQSLPLGSSKSQVETFLKKEKVEHSFTDRQLESTSVVEKSGLKPSQLSGIIQSTIRGTSRGFLVSGDTAIVFFFDKKSKLMKVWQREIFIGP